MKLKKNFHGVYEQISSQNFYTVQKKKKKSVFSSKGFLN